MTPEEKWKRLTNPQTAEDYGLSLTESELETFQAGRDVLAELRQYTCRLDEQAAMAAEMGRNAAMVVEQLAYGVLTASTMPPNV